MTRNSVGEWDTNADNNTDVGGINIAEGNPAPVTNNALREIMAQVRGFYNRETSEVIAFGGNRTAVISDRSKLLRFTGSSAATLAFGTASTLNNGWFIWTKNSGSAALTLNPAGAEQINGESTFSLPAGSEVGIFCDGLAFYTVGFVGFPANSNGLGTRTISTSPAGTSGDPFDIYYQYTT